MKNSHRKYSGRQGYHNSSW